MPMPVQAAAPAFPPTRQFNSRLGALLMLSGMFMFSGADVLAKYLTASFHPFQIIWFRQLGLVVGALVLLGLYGRSILATDRRGLHIVRGVLAVFSSLLFIVAVTHVPLAEAVAASFVAPFFLTILGALLLGEQVGVRRWSAVVIGFIGALIIVRPGMSAVHPSIMLVLLAACCYATRQVIGRLLADRDKTVTTVTYTALTAGLLTSLALPFVWQTPISTGQWLALLGMAMLGAIGEVLVIKALEVAEAVAVAPMHYSLLVWGTLYGYLVFNQLPDAWTWTGTAIIVGAGIYTLQRVKINQAE